MISLKGPVRGELFQRAVLQIQLQAAWAAGWFSYFSDLSADIRKIEQEEERKVHTPPETVKSHLEQLQLNIFRNWVHNEKWWITASDILKDQVTVHWVRRTNKNPT